MKETLDASIAEFLPRSAVVDVYDSTDRVPLDTCIVY
jgi:hypothetical protein